MATPPTLTATYSGGPVQTTSPINGTITVSNRDVLVLHVLTSDDLRVMNGAPSGPPVDGWVQQRAPVADTYGNGYLYTARATANWTGTLSVFASGGNAGAQEVNWRLWRWAGSGGIGATVAARASGAPSASITTTKADSALCASVVDWNARTGTDTYRAPAGVSAPVEAGTSSQTSAGGYYHWHHLDANAPAARQLGMTAPSTQKWTMLLTEVLADNNPGQVTGLSATPLSTSSTLLTWNAASDDVGIASYTIRRAGIVVATGVTSTNWTDSGLSAGTTYSYTVQAVDLSGQTGTQSASASVKTAVGLAETLTDDFEAGFDAAKWAYLSGSATNVAFTGGHVVFTPTPAYDGIRSVDTYNIQTSSFGAVLGQIPSQTSGDSGAMIIKVRSRPGDDSTSAEMAFTTQGTISCSIRIGGAWQDTGAGVPLPAGITAGRIRVQADRLMVWEGFVNGSWTTLKTFAVPTAFNLNATELVLQAGHWVETDTGVTQGSFGSANIYALAFTGSGVSLAGSGALGITTTSVKVTSALSFTGSGAVVLSGVSPKVTGLGLTLTGSGAVVLSNGRFGVVGAPLALASTGAVALTNGKPNIVGALTLAGSGAVNIVLTAVGSSGSVPLSGAGAFGLSVQSITVDQAVHGLSGGSTLGLQAIQVVVPSTGSIPVALSGGHDLHLDGHPHLIELVPLALTGAGNVTWVPNKIVGGGKLNLHSTGLLKIKDPWSKPIYVLTDLGVWREVDVQVFNGRAWLDLPLKKLHIIADTGEPTT